MLLTSYGNGFLNPSLSFFESWIPNWNWTSFILLFWWWFCTLHKDWLCWKLCLVSSNAIEHFKRPSLVQELEWFAIISSSWPCWTWVKRCILSSRNHHKTWYKPCVLALQLLKVASSNSRHSFLCHSWTLYNFFSWDENLAWVLGRIHLVLLIESQLCSSL